MDVDRYARKREGVNGTVIHDLKREGELMFIRRFCRQLLSERIDVGGGIWVIDQHELLLGVFCHLLSHFDVLLRAEHIAARPKPRTLGEKRDAEKDQRN